MLECGLEVDVDHETSKLPTMTHGDSRWAASAEDHPGDSVNPEAVCSCVFEPKSTLASQGPSTTSWLVPGGEGELLGRNGTRAEGADRRGHQADSGDAGAGQRRRGMSVWENPWATPLG